MTINEIEKSLQEKFNDEFTIKAFANFAFEFQECFSDILSTEELIQRIKKNVKGNIIVKDEFENKRLDGQYNKDGYICLKKSVIENESYTKYLLFHEMLHAVTSIRDENGNEIMSGFSYIEHSYGKGLNEAMTEYLTQIRNEKFEKNSSNLISDYRTIVEQLRRLILIIGDKKIKECYFHKPMAFKDLLNETGMNYDEVESAFNGLCEQDYDVYAMGHGQKLKENSNYKLHKYAEILFENYSKAIGEVRTLEDFKRKYKVFETCVDGNFDAITTMYIPYYGQMGKDINSLLNTGIPFEKIKDTLQILKINLDTLSSAYDFSKCFVPDKNKSAIEIYKYYKKNPNRYTAFFSQNYGMIFDHFSELTEYTLTPNDNTLYDYYLYPLKGLLIQDHPEIDYSEISCRRIKDENSKVDLVIFSSSNNEQYGYTTNGDKAIQYIDDKGNKILRFNVSSQYILNLIYQKDGQVNFQFQASKDFPPEKFKALMENLNFESKYYYSDKEDIEYWLQENSDDKLLQSKLNTISERINTRRKESSKTLQ